MIPLFRVWVMFALLSGPVGILSGGVFAIHRKGLSASRELYFLFTLEVPVALPRPYRDSKERASTRGARIVAFNLEQLCLSQVFA